MAKVTVAQLAKDLNLKMPQLKQILRDLGIDTNGAASLDTDTAKTIRDMVADMGDELDTLKLPPGVNVRGLAALLSVPPAEIQKRLMEWGQLFSPAQALTPELAERLVMEYDYEPTWEEPKKAAEPPSPPVAAVVKPNKHIKTTQGAQERAPIVTIMGHVDHGKTSLLDFIRHASVAEKEFGGITQHIGAYQADVQGKRITFLDTPGHEAFTKMRARGAQVTDIAVLVIAADDGVMPQTVEALNHAKSAGVEIIIALNKIDKPEANVLRVQQELSEYELVPREWGGNTEMVPVSAKEGTGVDTLLETILLTAELMELRADADAPLKATVIEAKLDKGRGPVATVLVLDGTLSIGDSVSVGESYGKIKAMSDFTGAKLPKAEPATPAEILGLSSVPNPGEILGMHKNEKEARAAAMDAQQASRSEQYQTPVHRVSLQDLYKQMSEGTVKDLNVLLKADVGGSAEAVREQLAQMHNDEVTLKVVYSGVGNINESDIDFATASSAIAIGFNVKVEPNAKAHAERQRVEVRTYQIIYELLEDIEKAMKGMLEPKFEEVHLGRAQIRNVFKLTRAGVIAGCYVLEGKITRNANARLHRGDEVIFTGKIASLRHLKENVTEMAAGFECGISLDGFDEIKEGDEIEAYEVRQVQ